MKRQMIALRKEVGLTQEQMAKLLGTAKSNISRLESINSDTHRVWQQSKTMLGYWAIPLQLSLSRELRGVAFKHLLEPSS